MRASRVYLIMMTTLTFANATMFTTYAVYYVNGLGFNPLELLLIGTALELTILVCETPTGVIADTRGRRISVLTGIFVIGLAFILEGSVPYIHLMFGSFTLFAGVMVAEVIRGVGETFISGAGVAWITDEIGDHLIGDLFLKSNQINQVMNLLGIVCSVILSSIALNLPYIIGGMIYLLLVIFLILKMKETNFKKQKSQPSVKHAIQTFRHGVRVIRGSTILLALIGAVLFAGAGSEGYDRLWEAHILTSFQLPEFLELSASVWIGLFSVLATVFSFAAATFARKVIDSSNGQRVVTVLSWLIAGKIIMLMVFALVEKFWFALGSFLVLSMIRTIYYPLYSTWLNQNIPSHSRATILSMVSQFDAFGQTIGGPVVGAIGTRFTIRSSLLAAGVFLLPVLVVYRRAIARKDRLTE
ncbi:MFS family permease [Bacillus pakistanensis]|uniref:MFS family permease n=1 Tax=Rossellomorea pakistanensis TaxID=992288 RepID=A0ABS2NIS7_9BACI|nr:MFS transporter [Bacillus pakistanensis]MBM7587777.1 MFS family permease [Bacillus pakistanensis]